MSNHERELEQSPRWEELKDTVGRIEGDHSNQGFPDTGPRDATEYLVLTRFSGLITAHVDFSTQYRSEGLRWRVLEGNKTFPRGCTLGQMSVAAWCELPPDES